MDKRHWAVIAAIILAMIAGIMFFSDSGPDEPEPEPEPEPVSVMPEPPPEPEPEPEPAPRPEPVVPPVIEPEPEPEPELPSLNDSDALVREQAAEVISEAELLQPALQTEQLVRRFAMVVENLAEGNLVRDPVEHLAPEGAFVVERRNDTPYVNPRSYRRYDNLARLVSAVDAEQAVALLDQMQPLLDEAYAELGLADEDPRARLRDAIDLLLEAPVVEGAIELRQPAVMFEYADESLEALLPAQKQLLRMGPDNQRRVQAKLREIRELL